MLQRSFFTRTRVTKLVITLIPVGLFAWLVNQNYVLTPSVHYRLLIGHTSGVIRIVEPGQVMKIKGQDEWRVQSDVLPFYIRIPRLLKQINVNLSGPSTNHPALVLKAKGAPGKPDQSILIRSSVLDTLTWPHVSDQTRTVWMNPLSAPKHELALPPSVDAFLSDVPEANIGVVNLDPQSIFDKHHFTNFPSTYSIGNIFRGQHEFYLGIPAGPLEFSLDKIDLNRKNGPDALTIVIWQSDITASRGFREIYRTQIGDDGNRRANSIMGMAQPAKVTLPERSQGIYKISIETSEDVTWGDLTSFHPFLGFAQRIYFAEGPAYVPNSGFAEFSIITNGTELGFAPDHEPGFQTIKIGRTKYVVDDLREKTMVRNLSEVTTALVEKGDLIITSDGLISFPEFKKEIESIPKLINLNAPSPFYGYDYVVAKYIPQPMDAAWSVSQQYSIADLRLLGKDLVFQLELPGTKKKKYAVFINQIETTLYRGNFPWDAIKRKLGI